MSTDVPVPFRARRSMACAALGPELYFFGGVGAQTGTESILDVSDELWRYDTEARRWEAVERVGLWPTPRRCVGWAPLGGELVLWGGSGVELANGRRAYTFLDDMWAFAPQRGWRELDAPGPAARYWPAFESMGETIVLFGGYTEDALGKRKLDDLWRFDGSEWQEAPERGPSARYGTAGAADGVSALVFGGASDELDHSDVWRYAPTEGWTCLHADGAGGPAPRYCASVALHDSALLVFGGRSRRSPKENYNDLWRFDLHSGRWDKLQPNRVPHRYDGSTPFPGYHAKAATAVARRTLYVWGGEGRHGHVSDFWQLDLDSLAWELLQPARADDPILW